MIILPQTIFYDDSQKAKQLFESSKIVYNACENLHICTREHFSYQLAKENYQNVYLFPDCVMYLTPEILKLSRNPHRKGVVTSLRQDVEKTRTEKEEQRIYSVLSKKFGGEIHNYDMLSDEPIPQEKRFEVVQGQMEHFRTAQLVVTDRLQGMIFSAVAETPCVVIKSQSYKVEGCYEWLKYLKYIKFIDNVENLEQACEEVLQVENATYNNECLMPYFSKLIDLMKKVESGEEICEIK
jgi:pyruvyl transferase EpsI